MIVVLGTMGNFAGALIGGLIIGVAEGLGAGLWPSAPPIGEPSAVRGGAVVLAAGPVQRQSYLK